jgi:DNA-binding beta-propeller fold protein YncE
LLMGFTHLMGQIKRNWEFFRRQQIAGIGSSVLSGTGQAGGILIQPFPSGRDEVWVADSDNVRIQVFDINGNFKKSFPVTSNPYDLYIYNEEVYVIVEFVDLNIEVYDLNGNLKRRWSAHPGSDELVVYKDKVYLAQYGSQQSSIGVYTLNGENVATYNIPYVSCVYVYNDRIYYGHYEPSDYYPILGVMELDGTPIASYNLDRDVDINDSMWVYNDEIFFSTSRYIDTLSYIDVYDINGNFKRRFGGSFGSGDGEFGGPYKYLCVYKDEIYVADTDNNRVQVFDLHGNFKRKFGSQGIGNGQFFLPHGIFVY